MRILVNDVAASHGGAVSILQDFYKYVAEYDRNNEYVFLLSSPLVAETDNIRVVIRKDLKSSRIKRMLFELFTGHHFIMQYCPDIVVSFQNTAVFHLPIPQIIYLHQSIPFQKIKKFSFFKKSERGIACIQYIIGFFIKISCRCANMVIVQSQWMKHAVIKSTGIAADKCEAIMPQITVADNYTREYDGTQDGICFFYPTSDCVYKNNDAIVQANKIIRNKGGNNFEIILTLAVDTVIAENIKCIGRIDREKLYQYYYKSVLVFPSYIETVGLPLLEAKACGALVLAADTDFAHECLDGYENGYFFDPFNPEELAELMLRVISGQINKKNIIANNNANITAWDKVVKIITASATMKNM